ncbi:MAG: hypothetical protein ACHQNV_07445 [Vicinamibacteria bacterium]
MPALSLLLLWQAATVAATIPLEPGRFWEYRESYTEERDGVASTTEETTRFEVRGARGHLSLRQTGGADPSSGPIEEGEGWVRLGSWTGEEPLPVPVEIGRVGPSPEAGGAGWTVEAEEEVVVPAGRFKALRCALRTWRSVSILWIAPNLGVVREIQGAPGHHPEIERVLIRSGGP